MSARGDRSLTDVFVVNSPLLQSSTSYPRRCTRHALPLGETDA